MIITLTKQQMLERWKLIRWLQPLRADCVVSRSDGIDLDSLAQLQMRQWYLDLLAHADPTLLATTELKHIASATLQPQGCALILLPPDTVRVIRVRLLGWQTNATIISDSSTLPPNFLPGNRFCNAGPAAPVAFRSGSNLWLYSPPSLCEAPIIDSLLVVSDPGPEIYTFREEALATIPGFGETNGLY